MLLPGAENFLNKNSCDLWTEQLANDRLILSQLDAAIVYFNSPEGADGIAEYTIDTGQDRQTVKRTDIGNLMSWRARLIAEVAHLERSLGLNGCAARRIVPGY
ncbi:MAG: hypothetical protein ACTTGZ_02505 [Treponema sp.]